MNAALLGLLFGLHLSTVWAAESNNRKPKANHTVGRVGKMEQAKADAQALTSWTLAFAEKMLLKNGEFYPFAAVVNEKGDIEAIAVDDGESEHPLSQHVIDLNKRILKLGAQSGKWRATALAYDVLTSEGPGMLKSDGIAFEIDHRDGFSKVLTLPYRLESGHIVYGEMRATDGSGLMYPRP